MKRPMINRAAAVAMVNTHFDKGTTRPKTSWHYGRVEIKELLDAIYGGPPNPKKLEHHIRAN